MYSDRHLFCSPLSWTVMDVKKKEREGGDMKNRRWGKGGAAVCVCVVCVCVCLDTLLVVRYWGKSQLNFRCFLFCIPSETQEHLYEPQENSCVLSTPQLWPRSTSADETDINSFIHRVATNFYYCWCIMMHIKLNYIFIVWRNMYIFKI